MTEYEETGREGVVVRRGLKPPSSNYSVVRCPYCRAEPRAYHWSLAGGGKKCYCGAKFGSQLIFCPPKGTTFDHAKGKFVKTKT